MSSNIIGLFPKKSYAPSEKVKKASGPLPEKSYVPSGRVKKGTGDPNEIEKSLVTTIDTVDKKGKSNNNVVEEANTSTISKKNIGTVDKTDKSQTSRKYSLLIKKINATHLTQWINQGLVKEIIYLIKYQNRKTHRNRFSQRQ